MRTRASVCLILLLVSALLLALGLLFNGEQVYPDDPNNATASNASESALNRAVAAGRLFRDPSGLLRIRASAACPT